MPAIQQRRGTAAELAAANETPLEGQIYYESDTNRIKIGNVDGSGNLIPYNDLPYLDAKAIADIAGLQDALDQKSTDLQNQISALVGDASTALDTLGELSDAINDDPAFFQTVAADLAVLQTNIDSAVADAAAAQTSADAAQATADGALQVGLSTPITDNSVIRYDSGIGAWVNSNTGSTLLGVTPAGGWDSGTVGAQFVSVASDITSASSAASAAQSTADQNALDIATLQTDVSNITPASIGAQPAGSYATLVNGTVPASQLPSFVDDVEEYASSASFPTTGETGKIYVDLSANTTHRWSGSAYVEISASPGSTDVVPEGSTNLYYTDARVTNVINNSSIISLSDVDSNIGPITPDNVLAYNGTTGKWSSSGVGSARFGSTPLGGWASGTTGAALDGKFDKSGGELSGNLEFHRAVANKHQILFDHSTGGSGGFSNAATDLDFIRLYSDAANSNWAGMGITTSQFNIGTQGAIYVSVYAQGALIDRHTGTYSRHYKDHYWNQRSFYASGATSVNPTISVENDSGTGIYFPSTGNVAIATNSTERLRIDNSGNVGIGASPISNYLLHIGGDASVGGTLAAIDLSVGAITTSGVFTTTNAILCTSGSATATAIGKFGDRDSGIHFPAADEIAISTGGTDRIHIDNNTITVERPASNPTIKADTANGGVLALDSSGGYVSINHYSGDDIYMAYTLGGSGNVIIGATTVNNPNSAGRKLWVNGTVASTGSVFLPDGTHSGPALTFTSDTDTGLVLDSAGTMSIVCGSSPRITVSTTSTTLAGTVSITDGLPLSELQSGGATTSQVLSWNGSSWAASGVPSHTHAQSEITNLTTDLAAKADLVNGLVPASQLPSYVDDVEEYAGTSNFPATGSAGKIYVDTATNEIYRWSGSQYILISASGGGGSTTFAGLTDTAITAPTNGEVVWYNGAWQNVSITSVLLLATSDNLAEGATNLYFTDARADARINLQTGANLDLSSKTTTDLAEGTNQYFTTARAETAALGIVGTTTNTICAGDDSRLSDARTPTAHTHPLSALTQSSASTGDVVTWNGSSWAAAAPSGGGSTTLSGLTDVSIASPVGGQFLIYSGTAWQNYSPTTAANFIPFNSLLGTSITAPSSGQILEHNGTNWVNVDKTPQDYNTAQSQWTMNGGGVVTATPSGSALYLKWSDAVRLAPVEKTEYGADGLINIACPGANATITYYHNTFLPVPGSKTATSDGIPLNTWEALWYVVTPGQSSGSSNSQFVITDYRNSTYDPGEGWVLLAVRNGSSPNMGIKWMPGQMCLPDYGGTWDSYNQCSSWQADLQQTLTAGTSHTIDLRVGKVFHLKLTPGAASTISLSNVPSTSNYNSVSQYLTVVLEFDSNNVFTSGNNANVTVSWPSNIKWPGNTAPTLTNVVGRADVVTLMSVDGGTNWLGFVGGQDFHL